MYWSMIISGCAAIIGYVLGVAITLAIIKANDVRYFRERNRGGPGCSCSICNPTGWR